MSNDPAEVPELAWLVALASLPGVGPARLAALTDGRDAREAWSAVLAGSEPAQRAAERRPLVARWREAAASVDVGGLWWRCVEAGVGVVGRGSPAYPRVLLEDPEPPAILFFDGDPRRQAERTAAIVGTRDCTRYGLDLAYELGGMLAEAGVSVVSGLAAGIDAAAHAGAIEAAGAAPVAVVAGGLDRPYPRENQPLWRRVAATGVVFTEAPLGVRPERWRFPARNRIIAGLSEITIVVESHESGGSLYTATEAMARDRPVLAVPGPIRSPASKGTNQLLADGCLVVTDLSDVLAVLELVHQVGSRPASVAAEPSSTGAAALLELFCWQPRSLEQLVDQSGSTLGEVSAALAALSEAELVVQRGRWFERVAR